MQLRIWRISETFPFTFTENSLWVVVFHWCKIVGRQKRFVVCSSRCRSEQVKWVITTQTRPMSERWWCKGGKTSLCLCHTSVFLRKWQWLTMKCETRLQIGMQHECGAAANHEESKKQNFSALSNRNFCWKYRNGTTPPVYVQFKLCLDV